MERENRKKKYEITVNRTDIYEIEVDTEIINDEWIKNFESYMFDVDENIPHEDLAKHIAQMRARFGAHQFMDGFGIIPVEGEYLTDKEQERIAKGFRIKVVSEDDEIEIDSREL